MAKDFYEIVKARGSKPRRKGKEGVSHIVIKKNCNEKPRATQCRIPANRWKHHKRRRLKPRVKRGV
jgi:hypothetical protein